MNILVISPVLPYPPNDGDRIRIYNFLKFFSGRNKIHLLSFINKGEEKNIDFLSDFCASVKVVPITKTKILFNAFKTFFSSNPINIGAYESRQMHDLVDMEICNRQIDLIYAYRIRCAPYAVNKGIPAVIDIVDSMALVNKRREYFEKNILRNFYIKIDYSRILEYERNLNKYFIFIFINAEDDAHFLKLNNTIIVPNGVDGKRLKKSRTNNFIIGFFGNIEYGPNYDAVMFFYKNIWKKISEFDKNIKLVIVGDKSNKLKNIVCKNITLKGYVYDIDREISEWDVSIVPVRYGAGRQNKILKSWACGIPVIATKFASMGVYGKNGENLLIAENADEFIEALNNLRNNKKLKQKLIKGGLQTVMRHFNWQKNLKKIDAVLRKVKIK